LKPFTRDRIDFVAWLCFRIVSNELLPGSAAALPPAFRSMSAVTACPASLLRTLIPIAAMMGIILVLPFLLDGDIDQTVRFHR
jgi:hypothetical protein